MTCIAVSKIDNKIILAADQQWGDGHNKGNVNTPKIFTKGEFTYGLAGNPKFADLLAYCFDEPELDEPSRKSLKGYFVRNWVPAFVELLGQNGVHFDGPDKYEGHILVVVHGQVFTIFDEMYVHEVLDYDAIGSGRSFALASMFTSRVCNGFADPKLAVESAIWHAWGVGGEADTITIATR